MLKFLTLFLTSLSGFWIFYTWNRPIVNLFNSISNISCHIGFNPLINLIIPTLNFEHQKIDKPWKQKSKGERREFENQKPNNCFFLKLQQCCRRNRFVVSALDWVLRCRFCLFFDKTDKSDWTASNFQHWMLLLM